MAGSRTPGPVGVDPELSPIDPGTTPRTVTPVPGTVPSITPAAAVAAKAYDVAAAVKHLDANAHPTSQGQCAKYVREALEAGGADLTVRPLYAKDYGPKLTALGFKSVDAKDYTPQKGDVIVLQPPKDQTAGHIEMFNGTVWVSDFVQRDEIYPGAAYRKDQVAYAIYRP